MTITTRQEAIDAIVAGTSVAGCCEKNCRACARIRQDAAKIVDAVIRFTREEHDRPGGDE